MSSQAQQLLSLFESLTPGDRATLLALAECLAARVSGAVPGPAREVMPLPEPEKIDRPPGESIVAGLKRLSQTYPMLDKSEMLGATSDIVASHIMQGTDAVQVIDKLEEIFAAHYRQMKDGSKGQ
jgi:hypothetical protein